MSDRVEKTGLLSQLPTLKKLKLQACVYFKPGTHKINIARLKIGSDANVCLHLKGNRDGFVIGNPSTLMTMMDITISYPRGFLDILTGHKVHQRWSSIKVIDGVPYLNEWHTDTKGALHGWDHRSTNIFKKYGDSIPTRYDPRNKRRYTEAEYDGLLDDFSAGEWMLPHGRFQRVRSIPVLGDAFPSGRAPKNIGYSKIAGLIHVLRTTQSWLEPETREEKIADRIFRTLGANIKSTSTTFEIILDKYERPGLIAVFGASNMIRGTFKTERGMQPPYNLNVNADVDLKRLSLAGLIDVRDASATISSRIRMVPGKLANMRLHVKNINAPVIYNGMKCMITDGRDPVESLLPGISITGDDKRRLRSTANVHARCEIPTPRGNYIVEGNILARLKGRWNGLTALPRITYGRNLIMVHNLTVRREGTSEPLIAGGSILISDKARDKQHIYGIHPAVPMVKAGLAVQLKVPIINGSKVSDASAATYIHMPLSRHSTHYDLSRFSLQNVLKIAFRFATKDRSKVKGNISATRQHKGWKIVARAQADVLTLGGATITKPTFDAEMRLRKLKWIDIRSLLATAGGVKYEDISVNNVRLNIKKGALMIDQDRATLRLDNFGAVAAGLDTGKMWISHAALSSRRRSPTEMTLSRSGIHLKRSSAYFSLMNLRPHGSKRRFSFRGHVGGRWKGNHGLLNIRLGKPMLKGTHLILSRISSYRKGGRLTAAFCLRKPTNLASLKSLGIQSKGIIWLISGSDHMPLTATSILGQLGIRGRGAQHRSTARRSMSVRKRCEQLFGVKR